MVESAADLVAVTVTCPALDLREPASALHHSGTCLI